MPTARHSLAVLFGTLLSIAFVAPFAHADGKVIRLSPDLTDPATMPDQRAIIAFDGTTQTLAVDTAFDLDPSSMTAPVEHVWIIPVPAEPAFLEVSPGAFDLCAALTAPRLARVEDGIPGSAIWCLAVAVVFTGVALDPSQTRARRCLILVVTLLILAGLFVVLFPTLGRAGAGSAADSTVTLLSRERVGLYETAALRADRAEDLLAWLRAEGFDPSAVPLAVGEESEGKPAPTAPPELVAAVQAYLDKGWLFAAARFVPPVDTDADPGADRQATARPHPLALRFETDAPVYPMALTAVGNNDIELELFVFADGTPRAPGLRLEHSRPIIWLGDDLGEQDFERTVRQAQLSDQAPIAHAGLARLAAGVTTISRLRGTLTPAQQADDIALTIEPARRHTPELYSTGARRGLAALILALGLAVTGFAAAVIRVGVEDPNPSPRRLLVFGAVLGAISAFITHLMLPSYNGAITGPHDAIYARALQHELEDIAERRIAGDDRPALDNLRAALLGFLVDEQDVRENPGVGAHDGPGGFDLTERPDGTVVLDTFGLDGRPERRELTRPLETP
ncbi:MAG: DUF2330 domain-containing protein [Planctomycetota bacterium]